MQQLIALKVKYGTVAGRVAAGLKTPSFKQSQVWLCKMGSYFIWHQPTVHTWNVWLFL